MTAGERPCYFSRFSNHVYWERVAAAHAGAVPSYDRAAAGARASGSLTLSACSQGGTGP